MLWVVQICVLTEAIAVDNEDIIFSKPPVEPSGEAFNIASTSEDEPKSNERPKFVEPSIIDCFAESNGAVSPIVSDDNIVSRELIITCI